MFPIAEGFLYKKKKRPNESSQQEMEIELQQIILLRSFSIVCTKGGSDRLKPDCI